MGDKDFKLPNIEKKFGLGKLKISNIEEQLGLDKWNELSRGLNQFTTFSNKHSGLGLGEVFSRFAKMDHSLSRISKILLANGTIKNAEAVKLALSPGMIKTFDFMTQIKMADSIISFQEMSRNLDYLKNSTIPHMSLYTGILNSIDERTYNWIREEERVYNPIKEEVEREEEKNIEDEDNSTEADFTIVRPECLNVAFNINVYVTVTENHIQSNADVSENEKTIWEKYVKPVLLFIMRCFIAWSMGDTAIADMQIVKQFDKVAEIIDNYHYPIETTDIDVNDEP